jgi:hypothetical protein
MHGSMGGGRKPRISRLRRATRAPLAYPTAPRAIPRDRLHLTDETCREPLMNGTAR